MVGFHLIIIISISKLVFRVEHGHHLVPAKLPAMHPDLRLGRAVNICILQKHLHVDGQQSPWIKITYNIMINTSTLNMIKSELTFPIPETAAPLGSGRGITALTKLPVQVLMST